MERWERGQHILLRDVQHGQVRAVIPVTVVEDTPELAAVYLRPGTPFCLAADADGRLTKDVFAARGLIQLTWLGDEQLSLYRPGAAHTVIARFQGEGDARRFVQWYVNLQSPCTRTLTGLDASDHILDVVISPDCQEHTWKDSEQFLEAVAGGYFTPAEAAAIHGEGDRVIELARKRRPPFNSGWENWEPDPSWTVPGLPDGWESFTVGV